MTKNAVEPTESRKNDVIGEAEQEKPAQKIIGRDKTPPRRKTRKDRTKELEGQLAESNDKYIRIRAEFENYRKRSQRDMADARALSKIATLEEILPVMDHFQMAMSASNSTDDLNTLKEGMNMILSEFERTFGNLGVEKIVTENQRFDPKIHEAVSTEASDTIADEHIMREWKAGYKLGDRLLRPAAVVVSSGPELSANDDQQKE